MTREEIELREGLIAYLCLGHRSTAQIHALEGLLPSSLMAAKQVYEDLAIVVSLYNPGGGPDYVDDESLEREIRWVLSQMGFDGC